MKRANVITLLLWACALGLGTWALREIDLSAVWAQMSQLTAFQYSVWFALNVFVTALSVLRWQILLSALSSSISLGRLLIIRLAGQTISFITPGPQFGGEPLQIYWLYKRCAIALHKAITSLGLDRIFELWVNFSVLLIGVLFLMFSPTMAFAQWGQITLILVVITIAMPITLFYFLNSPQKLLNGIRSIASRWLTHPKLVTRAQSWQQLESDLKTVGIGHRGALTQALIVSLAGWGLILAELYFLLYVLQIPITTQSFVLIAVAIRLAMLLPLPGGIGTIEAALLWSFQMLELPASDAFSLIALMRLRDIVILLAGFLSLRSVRTLHP